MTPVAMEHRHRLADVLGHVDEIDYHTVRSTAALARSSCVSAPSTSATHPGAQPAPSRRSSPGGVPADAAASARHRRPPRPDRRPPPGCVDRGVLAGACASTPGLGPAPVRARSHSSAGLRAMRGFGISEDGLGHRIRRLVGGSGAVSHVSHRSTLPPSPDRVGRLTGTAAVSVHATSIADGTQRDPEGTSREPRRRCYGHRRGISLPQGTVPKRGGAALLRRRPKGLLPAARQELLDPSKAWWGGRRGRLADRPRYSISVSLGVVPRWYSRVVEVPVRIEVAAGFVAPGASEPPRLQPSWPPGGSRPAHG